MTFLYNGCRIEVINCTTCYRWRVVKDNCSYAPMTCKDEAATVRQAKEAAQRWIDSELNAGHVVRPSVAFNTLQAARNVVANIPGSVLFGGWF